MEFWGDDDGAIGGLLEADVLVFVFDSVGAVGSEVEVEVAITVIIGDGDGVGAAGVVDASGGGDIGESAIAVIEEQFIGGFPVGDEEVEVVIVIEVSEVGGHAEAAGVGDIEEAGGFGGVFELEVAGIAEEAALARLVLHEDVDEAVVVVVAGGDAGAVIGIFLLERDREVVLEVDTGLVGGKLGKEGGGVGGGEGEWGG